MYCEFHSTVVNNKCIILCIIPTPNSGKMHFFCPFSLIIQTNKDGDGLANKTTLGIEL